MKKSALCILFLATAPLFFTDCTGTKEPQGEDEPVKSVAPTMPDSAFYGHLGEGTGMSCLQLITGGGDTLIWIKTNERTGESGRILGEIENYSDSFSVTSCGGNEYVSVALNISELIGKNWHKESAGGQDSLSDFLLKVGGQAVFIDGRKEKTVGYNLYNCRLVFVSGDKLAGDTFDICCLSSDRLTLCGKACGDTLNFRLNKD